MSIWSFIKTQKKILSYMQYIITLFLIYYIFNSIGINQIISAFRHISFSGMVISFAGCLGFVLLQVVRYHILIKEHITGANYLTSLKAYVMGLGIGLITPGKLGEAVRVLYYPGNRTLALSALMVERVCVVLGLLITSNIAAVLYYRSIFPFTLGATTLLLGGVYFRKVLASYLARILKVESKMNLFLQYAVKYKMRQFMLSSFIYCFCLVINGCQLYILLNYPPKLTYSVTTAAVTITTFASLLPVTVAGLGVREGALIALLSQYNIPNNEIVAASLILYAIYAIPSSIIALILLSRFPLYSNN